MCPVPARDGAHFLWGAAPMASGRAAYCNTLMGRLVAFFDSSLGNEMLSTPF